MAMNVVLQGTRVIRQLDDDQWSDPYAEVFRGVKMFSAQTAFTGLLDELGAQTESGTTSGTAPFYLNPAWFTVSGRSPFLRLIVTTVTNATAMGTVTAVVSLKPVATAAGATGALTVTTGAAVANSSVSVVNPGAGALLVGDSGDFACPAAGFYAIEYAQTGAMAAAAASTTRVSLLRHSA